MKIRMTICWMMTASLAFGQFAIIDDKDGFCNVRSSAEKGNNVIDRLENGYIVYCFPNKTDWIGIDYAKNGADLHGHIYQNRVMFISNYFKVPVLTQTNVAITLKKDSIEVIVRAQKFDKSQHQLSYHQAPKNQIALIDHKKYWGTDGGVPKRAYQSIEVTIGARKIILPKAAFEDLYEPTLYNTQANYDQTNDILYIHSMNSDGAGGYEVIWKIEHGVYKDRYIEDGF
jgi:hypothetical protein